MTDYLELLLEPEEDGEKEALKWETPAIPGPAHPEKGNLPPWEQERRVRDVSPEKKRYGGEEEENAETPKELENNIGKQLDRLETEAVRAAQARERGTAEAEKKVRERETELRRVKPGAEKELYRRVQRLRRAAEVSRSEGRSAEQREAPRQKQGNGLTAEGLDRAVERDARRYDGGFGLY